MDQSLIVFLSFAGIILLAMALAFKMDRIKQLSSTVNNLKNSLDEMDEQAKLIVSTDMELNKTQEELDKKIGGLYALQRLSRAISTTLEEQQIFRRIESYHLEELGFEKALAFLFDEKNDKFILQMNIGYPPEEVESICGDKEIRDLFVGLIKNEKAISSGSLQYDKGLKKKIDDAFAACAFVFCPVLPKQGEKGLLFVGTQNLDTIVTEGDEELLSILANQLGQAIDNARLFEKTWGAQQELEKKVEERTRELSSALDEVKAISRRKTDFVSSVSHELRTPLTSIKGYASILLAGKLGDIPKEIKERLGKINRHSDELVHMVTELLDISRIEAGKMLMKKEPLELSKLVDKIADLLSVQLKEKDISFSCAIPEEAGQIYADRAQIERVLVNIIGNAIKFTPLNGRIGLASRLSGNTIQIEISDSGCGIPLEAQESIFEEFYRVDNPVNQEVKGTGLGLALVKHIVEAHKGKIWVKSRPEAGSTFIFTLPQND